MSDESVPKKSRTIRVCSRCGTPLGPEATKYTTLCPECRTQAKRESVTKSRTCRTCGGTFLGGPRAWYCPNCRIERQRETNRRHKATGSDRKLGSIQTCERCGQPYTLTSGRQRYCPDCAPEAVKEAVAPKKREQARNYDPDHSKRRARHAETRRCVICGKPITGDRAKNPVNTCSEACNEQRRKLRQYEADVRRGRERNPPKPIEKD